MMAEKVQGEVKRDMQTDDWQDKDEDQMPMDSALEFERFQWIPDAKEKWNDLGKDAGSGNLDKAEMLSIHLNEIFRSNIEALRSLSPNAQIAEFFFPETLMQAPSRRNASTLVLSLSKDGFWRKLSRSKITQKGYSMDNMDSVMGQEKPEQKMKWMLWKKGGQRGS